MSRVKQTPRIVRLAFSFPVALTVQLIFLTVITMQNRFDDPDMWWNLKTGEIIWKSHHIPTVDAFSYTVAGQPWIAQEWLSQLSIYAAYHFGGYSGLMLWACVTGSLLLIGGYLLCSLYSGNAKVAFAGAMTIWLFATIAFSIRPQLLGYLLLMCEFLILQLGHMGDRRWFYGLPVLFCLWINVHSSFILGLIIAAIILISTGKEFQLGLLKGESYDAGERKSLLIAIALSIAALFINPIGPKLIVYPLNVMLKQQLNLGAVSEWQPPPLGSGRGLALVGLASLVLLIPIMRRVEITLRELGLTAMGFWLAAEHERMLIVFGIVAAPILSRMLADTWQNYDFAKDRIFPNAIVAVAAAGLAFAAFPDATKLNREVEQGSPVAALAFIRRAGLGGNMLNDYRSGGYLIWAAPERKVFIDSRADLYDPSGVMAEFGRWALLEENTEELLMRRDIRYCLLAPDAPVIKALRLLPNWKEIYADRLSVVFARN